MIHRLAPVAGAPGRLCGQVGGCAVSVDMDHPNITVVLRAPAESLTRDEAVALADLLLEAVMQAPAQGVLNGSTPSA